MRTINSKNEGQHAGLFCRGLTLTEVIVSVGIGALVFGGIILAYVQSATRAEWSALSFAAQSLAWQRLEQTRAAKWDTQAAPPVDQVVASNFPPQVGVLDVPISGTNIFYATSYVKISMVSTNPPLKMVVAEAVWAFKGRLYTNSVITYRGPDQ